MKPRNPTTMSRRKVLRWGAACFAGLSSPYFWGLPGVAYAQPKPPAKLAEKLHLLTLSPRYAEVFMKAWGEPFSRQYGVKFTTEVAGQGERILSNLRVAKGEYDLAYLSDVTLYPAVQEGLIEPFRLENVPNYRNIADTWQSPKPVPSKDKYVAVTRPGMYLYVRVADKVQADQDSYSPAFDPKYAGRIALRDYPIYRILQTAAYLGMDINNISSIDKVFDALKEQRKLVRVYWRNAAEFRLLLANREVWIGDYWISEVMQIKDQLGLKYWFPKEGIPAWVGGDTIVKGTKNRDTAEFFINWTLEPQRMLDFAMTAGEVPTIRPELFDVAKYRRDSPDISALMDALATKGRQLDIGYALSHPEWLRRFDEMKAGA